MSEAQDLPPGVDPTVPSAGRLYDYYLGGTEYLEVDRLAGDKIFATVPELGDIVWSNRGFLQRASKQLAAEVGIRQFIDIGAGLPTRNNTHEAVQSVAPDASTVYVDNDPMILAHARSLLEGVDNTEFITGDLRDPDSVLGNPELRSLINFDEPVALMMAAVVHFVSDEADPWGLMKQYMNALTPGSYLCLSHITSDNVPPEGVAAFLSVYNNASENLYFRRRQDVERLFDGLELLPPYDGAEPGVTFTGFWGAEDPEAADSDGSRWGLCGVARKP
ncbi:SAM-dependent methyltransferase [Actinopolymorpha alba]|uniref:SAM-dependent methyltransferase n=1 Tax=Actinopolymorpha alba TaxID=533267 RepID=UPI0003738983|nr:SAM-dependent methyltransferase [Actinopolymorpha alba]